MRLLRTRVLLERLSFSVAHAIHVYLLEDDGRRVRYSGAWEAWLGFGKALEAPKIYMETLIDLEIG